MCMGVLRDRGRWEETFTRIIKATYPSLSRSKKGPVVWYSLLFGLPHLNSHRP